MAPDFAVRPVPDGPDADQFVAIADSKAIFHLPAIKDDLTISPVVQSILSVIMIFAPPGEF
ncbi:MAG: hypothetical protein U5L07_05905 [Desulfobacterales bacterium]|nr:hypothetical protein [Desulfobacterales bacterium]